MFRGGILILKYVYYTEYIIDFDQNSEINISPNQFDCTVLFRSLGEKGLRLTKKLN